MDQTNIHILHYLQENCRSTMKEIGENVGLTSPAVSERIRKLEEDGAILGYHAHINPLSLGNNISAFVEVDVPARHYDRFLTFCNQAEAVIEHHHIIGPYNSMLRVAVHDSEQLESFLSQIKSYGNSQTQIILSTYFTHGSIDETNNF